MGKIYKFYECNGFSVQSKRSDQKKGEIRKKARSEKRRDQKKGEIRKEILNCHQHKKLPRDIVVIIIIAKKHLIIT